MSGFGGQTMAGRLERVMVASPRTAGWSDERAEDWKTLGFGHAPQVSVALSQHSLLERKLVEAGADVVQLPAAAALTLDAAYAHDSSFMTDHGVILLRPGKRNRRAEVAVHAALYRDLSIPILGMLTEPATCESGDMLWLDATTLLVGYSLRTNRAAISQLRAMLGHKGIEVMEAAVPYGLGEKHCLHLLSFMSPLSDEPRRMVVDIEWLSVETVELLRAKGYELILIDTAERETLAANVLALGDGRVIAIAANERTNRRMEERGLEVEVFDADEICINGSGGPTCLTRPLLRS